YGWAIRGGKPMLVAWGSVAGEKISKDDPRAKDAPIIGKDGQEYDKKGKKVNYSEDSDYLGNNNYVEMESRLAQLEAILAKETAKRIQLERESTVRDFTEFTEGLYAKGQLTETLVAQEEIVDLLTGLHYKEIEYSEEFSPAYAVMAILEKLPQMVDFNDYSEEDLKPIDTHKDPVTQATELMKERNIEFTEAIKEVLYPTT
ncbi:MAG: hypothetical protein R3321_01900, partial [Nitrososphaeraceae archaeon]|nr:hypothetical protein [Nitrososphaeraceae archaeon]